MFGSLSRPGEPRPAAATKSSVQLFKQPISPSPCESRTSTEFLRRPGQANGSRECAPDDRLRASRDRYAVSHVWRDTVRRLSRKNVPLWLWVPAFAGTTMRGIPRTHPCSRGALRPSCPISFAPKRAWGMPGAKRTRSLAWENKNHTSVVTAGTRRNHPAFPHAIGFNGFLRALPGDRAFLPPSPADHGVSGPLGPTSPPPT